MMMNAMMVMMMIMMMIIFITIMTQFNMHLTLFILTIMAPISGEHPSIIST